MLYSWIICYLTPLRKGRNNAKTKKKSTNFINQPFDFILCAVIFILLALGIVMVLSASAPSALAETGKTYSYASKQLLAAILGIFGMFFFSKINYNVYKKCIKWHMWFLYLYYY